MPYMSDFNKKKEKMLIIVKLKGCESHKSHLGGVKPY